MEVSPKMSDRDSAGQIALGDEVVPSVAFDDVRDAASSPSLPLHFNSEVIPDDVGLLRTLPDDLADAVASVEASASPVSPESSQAPVAAERSSPLLLGQELSGEMSGASDPWLPTPSLLEEIGADADDDGPAVACDEIRDSLSTPSPHNDHSYTAPASPAAAAASPSGDDGSANNNGGCGDGQLNQADGSKDQSVCSDRRGLSIGDGNRNVDDDDSANIDGVCRQQLQRDDCLPGLNNSAEATATTAACSPKQKQRDVEDKNDKDSRNEAGELLVKDVCQQQQQRHDRKSTAGEVAAAAGVAADSPATVSIIADCASSSPSTTLPSDEVPLHESEQIMTLALSCSPAPPDDDAPRAAASDGAAAVVRAVQPLANSADLSPAASDAPYSHSMVHPASAATASVGLVKEEKLQTPAVVIAALIDPGITIKVELDSEVAESVVESPAPVVCTPLVAAPCPTYTNNSPAAVQNVAGREPVEESLAIDVGPSGRGSSPRRSRRDAGARAMECDSPASALPMLRNSVATADQESSQFDGSGEFACHHCPKSFSKSVNLRRHIANAHHKPWLKATSSSQLSRQGNLQQAGTASEASSVVRCVCCNCRRSYRNLAELRDHRKYCSEVGGLAQNVGTTACGTCGHRCVSAVALQRHLQSHRPKVPPRVVRLASRSPSSNSFRQPRSASDRGEVRVTADAPAFECSRCGDSLPDAKSFIAHMETHASEPAPYERCSPKPHVGSSEERSAEGAGDSDEGSVSASHLCDQCGRTFRCPKRLLLHIARHEAAEAASEDGADEDVEGGEPRLCDKCGMKASSAERLERHMATVHGDDDDNEEDEVMVDVSEGIVSSASVFLAKGDRRPVPDTSAKENGTRSSGGVVQLAWNCHTCAASFSTELELKRHMLKHSFLTAQGQTVVSAKSNSKGPSMNTSGRLQQGQRRPAKNRRFGKGIAKHRQLRYSCRRCSRRFSLSCSRMCHELAEHVGIAGGRGLPTCHKCGRQFRARQLLRNHLSRMHARPVPSCAECGLRCSSAVRLRWHWERRHGDVEMPRLLRRPGARRQSTSRPHVAAAGAAASGRQQQQRMYRCRHCVARYRHAQQLWLHSLRRHPLDIIRTGLGVVRGLEMCSQSSGKTLPLHRVTMWHSCLHCLARYRQLETLWRHTRLCHRDRLVDIDGMLLLPNRCRRSLTGSDSQSFRRCNDAGGGSMLAKPGSSSAAGIGAADRGGRSGVVAGKPVAAVITPTRASTSIADSPSVRASAVEQSKQLIARNFKIAPGGRESVTAPVKPRAAGEAKPSCSTGPGSSSNPIKAGETQRNQRSQRLEAGTPLATGSCGNEKTTKTSMSAAETPQRAERSRGVRCTVGDGSSNSLLVGTRGTRSGDAVRSSASADRRLPEGSSVGGAAAAVVEKQAQHQTSVRPLRATIGRPNVLEGVGKEAAVRNAVGSPQSSSGAAAAPAGQLGQRQQQRRLLPVAALPTVRQQAMCLWCEATFPRLAMLAEHACVHRDELQKIILQSVGMRN